MIMAGIGAQKGVKADDVLAALDAALRAHALERKAITALCTNAAKASEDGIKRAAKVLGIDCLVVAPKTLAQAAERTISRSGASIAATGLASLSEAAALAGAGRGARLLGPRVAVGPVTCALATNEDRP